MQSPHRHRSARTGIVAMVAAIPAIGVGLIGADLGAVEVPSAVGSIEREATPAPVSPGVAPSVADPGPWHVPPSASDSAVVLADLPTIDASTLQRDTITRIADMSVRVTEDGVTRDLDLDGLPAPIAWAEGLDGHGWLIVTDGTTDNRPAFWLARGADVAVAVEIPADEPDRSLTRSVTAVTSTVDGPAVVYTEHDFAGATNQFDVQRDWWIAPVDGSAPSLLARGTDDSEFGGSGLTMTSEGHAFFMGYGPPSYLERSWAAPLELNAETGAEWIDAATVGIVHIDELFVGSALRRVRVDVLDVMSGEVTRTVTSPLFEGRSAHLMPGVANGQLLLAMLDIDQEVIAMDLRDGSLTRVDGDMSGTRAHL